MSDLVESTAPTSQTVLVETSPVAKDPSTATLNIDSFPHILDSILDHCSFSTLLALRGASRALRDRADAHLVAHVALVLMKPPFPPSSVRSMASLPTKSFDMDKWHTELPEVHDWRTHRWPMIKARRGGEYHRIPRNCWMDVPTLGAAVRVLDLNDSAYSRFISRLNFLTSHLPHLAVIRTNHWCGPDPVEIPCRICGYAECPTAVSYAIWFHGESAEARYHPVYDTNSRHLRKWRVLPSQPLPSTGWHFVVLVKEPHSIIKRGLSSKSVARISRQQSLKVAVIPSISAAFRSGRPSIIVGLEEWAPDLGDSPQSLLIDELSTLLDAYWKRVGASTYSKEELSERRHLFILMTRREYVETMGIDAMDLQLYGLGELVW